MSLIDASDSLASRNAIDLPALTTLPIAINIPGHIVLKHVPIGVDVSSTGILLVSEYSADDEDEANWLADALLLPRDSLKRYREKGWPVARIVAYFGARQDMYNWRIRMTGVDVQMLRSRPSV